MRYDNFSVRIVGGRESKDGYVEMQHGRTYSIQMENENATRCDATVQVDGTEVGTWRINAYDSITIERPADIAKLFTFYRLGSVEGEKAGLRNNGQLGLVSVTFKPEYGALPSVSPSRIERGYKNWRDRAGEVESYGLTDYGPTRSEKGAGGTGLSSSSGQTFSTTSALIYDHSKITTIHLRLVEMQEDIQPLYERQRSTPIPPPLNKGFSEGNLSELY